MNDQFDSTGWYQQHGWRRDCTGKWYPPDRSPGPGWWIASDGVWYPPVPRQPRRVSPTATRVIILLSAAFWGVLLYRGFQYGEVAFQVYSASTILALGIALVSARWGRHALLLLGVLAPIPPLVMIAATGDGEGWAFGVSLALGAITIPALVLRELLKSPVASPAAGWYTDPDDPGLERFWQGTAWTDSRKATHQPPGADT